MGAGGGDGWVLTNHHDIFHFRVRIRFQPPSKPPRILSIPTSHTYMPTYLTTYVRTYIHTYIHATYTYLRTYVRTFIDLPSTYAVRWMSCKRCACKNDRLGELLEHEAERRCSVGHRVLGQSGTRSNHVQVNGHLQWLAFLQFEIPCHARPWLWVWVRIQ